MSTSASGTQLCLRDTAAKWYESIDGAAIQTWVDFTTNCVHRFVHLDQRVAKEHHLALRQTGMFATTQSSLELLLLIPDMAEPDALDKYIRGLKDFTWKTAKHFVSLSRQ
jgi:hypothetical protein